MIPLDTLRFFPFFGTLADAQLRRLAELGVEESFERGETLFLQGQPAETLYFLVRGCIDLFYSEPGEPDLPGIPVGEINPGEIFSISALVEPRLLTSTARASHASRVVKFNAARLDDLFQADPRMASLFMRQVAQGAIERLHYTRIQLAAEWAA
jgi:CRP-like cAMP-binding protein